MDISLASDDSLGSLFATDDPTPNERLRTMYIDYVDVAQKAKQAADEYANKRDQEDLRELLTERNDMETIIHAKHRNRRSHLHTTCT